jgi:hypothetical protein
MTLNDMSPVVIAAGLLGEPVESAEGFYDVGVHRALR